MSWKEIWAEVLVAHKRVWCDFREILPWAVAIALIIVTTEYLMGMKP